MNDHDLPDEVSRLRNEINAKTKNCDKLMVENEKLNKVIEHLQEVSLAHLIFPYHW